MGARLTAWAFQAWGCDRRSLALMRISYGFLILSDLGVRATALREHYSNQGVFPVRPGMLNVVEPYTVCFHSMSGSVGWAGFLFALHALAAVALLLGWRTRAATMACFVLYVSLHNRNYTILNGGDAWLRLVLFWAVFMPWGDRFSLDSLKQDVPEDQQASSVATYGYILQMLTIYFISALFKDGASWREEGSAVYLSLHMSEWNSDFGYTLLFFPKLLVFLSWGVMILELVGPFLLLSPVAFGPVRGLTVLIFMLFHFGLILGMRLGMFPWVGICSLVGLLPAWIWGKWPMRRLEEELRNLFSSASWPSTMVSRAGSGPCLKPGWRELVLGLAALFSLAHNASTYLEHFDLPAPVANAGKVLRLDQYWGLFAPEPARSGGWPVLEGVLKDGSSVDLRTHQPLDWDEPFSSSVYRNQRWKRWYVVVHGPTYKVLRPAFGRYLFREWDRRHPERAGELVRLKLAWVQRATLEHYEDSPAYSDVFLEMTREEAGF